MSRLVFLPKTSLQPSWLQKKSKSALWPLFGTATELIRPSQYARFRLDFQIEKRSKERCGSALALSLLPSKMTVVGHFLRFYKHQRMEMSTCHPPLRFRWRASTWSGSAIGTVFLSIPHNPNSRKNGSSNAWKNKQSILLQCYTSMGAHSRTFCVDCKMWPQELTQAQVRQSRMGSAVHNHSC